MVLVSYKPMILVSGMEVVMHFLHTGRERETLSGTEEHRTTLDGILAFFGQGDAPLAGLSTPPHAPVWPRAGVTLGVRQALTGVGHRAFSRWLTRASRAVCPRGPARPRLLRLFLTPPAWTATCWAAPTVCGVLAPSGLAVLHPSRAGRRRRQSGRPGLAHPRGIVGGTWCLRLHQDGVGVAWDSATAHGPDQTWQWRMRQGAERRLVCSATACQAAAGDPATRTRGPRGAWHDRLRVETVRSRLTLVRHVKKVRPRVWEYCQARRACTMAALPGLGQW